MEKMVFLATLAGKLSEYPMEADAIENSVAQVKGYIDRVSDADFAAEPATEEDIAGIAKDIYEKYVAAKEAQKKAEEEAAAAAEAEAVKEAAKTESAVPEELGESEESDIEQTEDAADFAEYELIDNIFLSETEEESTDAAQAEPESVQEAGPVTEPVLTEESLDIKAQVDQLLNDDEPLAPEEIIEQLVSPDEYEETAAAQPTDEEFFEMLAKEAEGERSDKARLEELKLKALAMANKEDPEMVAQVLSQDEELVEIVAASDIADEFDPIEAAFDPEERPDIAFEEAQELEEVDEFEVAEEFEEEYIPEDEFAPELMIDKDELRGVDDKKSKKNKKTKKIKPKKEKEKVKGTPLFWTLFILTLPITLPLYLCVCVFYGLLYVAVSALIAIFASAMVATVACGTAVSLVGIIYGSVQCFGNVPIGLFEIGIGVVIGGATMLLSVLLYNVAIRYIPRLFKPVNRFAAWGFDGIGQLYTKIKKECGKRK
ncbi:MAG: hypothetical protein IKT46_08235 [Clostridia bacterium]|nr:hypothetical protein [Clostridia bacterium]